MAAQGAKITAHELLDAQMKRGALGLHMNLFHRDYDLLVTPTLSIAAFDAGKEVADKMLQERWTDWTPFSFPFNLTQQPAASIPCGLTKAGLPVGLHLVGPRYADALVLRAARAFEAGTAVRNFRTSLRELQRPGRDQLVLLEHRAAHAVAPRVALLDALEAAVARGRARVRGKDRVAA